MKNVQILPFLTGRRVAKLECFTIDGVELWFFSSDHLPPHFHAKRRGHWEVRVNFLESSTSELFEVIWLKGKEVPRGHTKLLEEKVARHRADLFKEWESKVQPQ